MKEEMMEVAIKYGSQTVGYKEMIWMNIVKAAHTLSLGHLISTLSSAPFLGHELSLYTTHSSHMALTLLPLSAERAVFLKERGKKQRSIFPSLLPRIVGKG